MILMKKQKLKSNKGITTGDIIISIIIIIMFISIITTSFYNYYLSTQSKTRRTMATNALIDIIENVEMMDYSNVDETAINTLIQEFISDGTIPSGYNVSFTLTNYNETENNTDKLDLIKILNVKVSYILNDKEETFEITRLITK